MVKGKKKIVVIGGGMGGLASASLLAKKGYDVTLCEKNHEVGGRAVVKKTNAFVFDRGPSWYMMPEFFDQFFALFGKKTSDYYDLVRLDPRYRVYSSQGTYIDYPNSYNKTRAIFQENEPNGALRFDEYMKKMKVMYEVSVRNLLQKSYESIFDLLHPSELKSIISLISTGFMFQSLHKDVSSYIKSPELQKTLEFHSVFLGGSPFNTPSLYGMLSYADVEKGIWYPIGGMGKLISALYSLCKEQGVTVYLDSDVTKINVENSRVTGVVTKQKTIPADIVVSNGDYAYTELHLLEENSRSYNKDYWNSRTWGISALLIFLGIKGKLHSVPHHSLVLDKKWENHFEDIFTASKWPEHPNYYVSVPSVTDNSVAPQGCENLFILVPLASGMSDSESVRSQYSDFIISHLEKTIGQKIRDRILVKEVVSQRDFESLYHAHKGTALGLAHTLFQSVMFRPRMKSSRVRGLYYVGQYTQPGVGMPMVIRSAQVVSDKIEMFE